MGGNVWFAGSGSTPGCGEETGEKEAHGSTHQAHSSTHQERGQQVGRSKTSRVHEWEPAGSGTGGGERSSRRHIVMDVS